MHESKRSQGEIEQEEKRGQARYNRSLYICVCICTYIQIVLMIRHMHSQENIPSTTSKRQDIKANCYLCYPLSFFSVTNA